MDVQMQYIEVKPSDFKICEDCGSINWYENEDCYNCSSTNFDNGEEAVIERVQQEYDFYKNEGYTETEIDHITIEV